AGRAQLADDQPGDQEPRQDEEDVDPDVAGLELRETGVIEEDEADSDRPQALELGAELAARGSRLVRGDAAHEGRLTSGRSPGARQQGVTVEASVIPCDSSQRSASIAALQPSAAAVTA